MKVRIDIDTSTFVRFWLVVIGFVAAIYAIYLARTAVVILLSAAFLALALNTPVNMLSKYLPGRSRVGGTAVAFVIVVLLLGAFIALVVPPIVEQTAKIVYAAPVIVDTVSQQWHGIGDLVEKYNIQPQVDAAVQSMREQSSGWIGAVSSNILGSVGSAFGLIGSLFLTLVLSFLMLVEGPLWMKRVWGAYSDGERRDSHQSLALRMHHVITGYVTGQLTVSGIGALCAGAVVFLLSLIFPAVPTNLSFAVVAIAFLFSLIPMFGATIAGILVTLLLLVNSIPAAIVFAIFFVVYQQIENNFISPTIQSKYVELSPLAVLVAVTIGLYLFGLAGGIISIPIAGCIKVLIEEYFARAKRRRKQQDKPVAKLVKKLQGEA